MTYHIHTSLLPSIQENKVTILRNQYFWAEFFFSAVNLRDSEVGEIFGVSVQFIKKID